MSDFLFDDTSWLVRWLVVDTGHWLSGRKVLLPPSVVRHIDPKEQEVSVGLTMQQVKDSPAIDTGAVLICVGIDFGAISSVTKLSDHAARSML